MNTRPAPRLPLLPALVAGLLAAAPVLALTSDRERTVSMEAFDIDVDFASGTRTLERDVVIVQGTTQIFADKVVAEMGEEELDTLTAWGKPAIFKTLPDGQTEVVVAKGDRLVFDNTNRVVTMTGNARIEQREDVITGGVITYDLTTEAFKVSRADPASGAEGQAASGRPRIVIQPRAGGKSGAAPGPAPGEAAAESASPEAESASSEAPASTPESAAAAPADETPAPAASEAVGDAATAAAETAAEEPEPAASVGPDLPAPTEAAAIGEAVAAMVVFYETYYELGDAERLVSLFAVDGAENELQGRAALRAAYERLFARTRSRQTQIEALETRQTQAGQWVVRGTVITEQVTGDGQRAEDTRPVEFSFVDEGGMLRIRHMRY